MSASISCSMPQSQAFSLKVLELLSMGINPTKFSRFSKDLRKKLPVFSINTLGNLKRRLADTFSCNAVNSKGHLQHFSSCILQLCRSFIGNFKSQGLF